MVLLPIAIVAGLVLGPQIITPFGGDESGSWVSDRMILEQLRLPRVLLSALVGASLAMAGVIMQGLFRNPLADPTLIGVSGGASAGASLAIVLGPTLLTGGFFLGTTLIALCSFFGAALATLLVYSLARNSNGTSVATMLLAGIAINSLAAALNKFFSFIADNQMLRQISLWEMGSLAGATWQKVGLSAVLLGSILLLSPVFARTLNAFLLGESEARHLGVPVAKVKKQMIVLVALVVGLCVAMAGTIAFVGLVVPHIVRLAIGPDHRYLIPCSALAGASLLVLADAASRYLMAPGEIPIGILTSLLGAPFFLSLLRRQRLLGNF